MWSFPQSSLTYLYGKVVERDGPFDNCPNFYSQVIECFTPHNNPMLLLILVRTPMSLSTEKVDTGQVHFSFMQVD